MTIYLVFAIALYAWRRQRELLEQTLRRQKVVLFDIRQMASPSFEDIQLPSLCKAPRLQAVEVDSACES